LWPGFGDKSQGKTTISEIWGIRMLFDIRLPVRKQEKKISLPQDLFSRNSMKSNAPDYQTRLEREVATFERLDLTGSIRELQCIAKCIQDAGHRLQVTGSAASSLVFHAIGISSVCPIEHELHLERFIDPDIRVLERLDVTCLVSMSNFEVQRMLWSKGYKTFVQKHEYRVDDVPQVFETIDASQDMESKVDSKIRLKLVVPTELAIASLLQPEQIKRCLQDSATWDLVGRGDTEGITHLEDVSVQELLRERRPSSVLELAKVMFCRHQSDDDDMRVEFQEELMSQLHRDFGLPLRIAYETIRRVVSSNPNRLESTKQELWIQGKENGLNDDILVKVWKAILEKSPHAICKAHALSVAHLALQTAYLKAHRNEVFWTATKNKL